MIEREFTHIDTNGVTLRTVVEGDGPLVIMLHGWPQGWFLWRQIIDPVVAAGYRVAVPDMRGFGGSSCPENPKEYNMRLLAADVAGIATELGEENFTVIGQDWGNIVAWYTALYYPKRCSAVLGMSVPFWRIGPEIAYPPGKDDSFWYFRHAIENPEAAAAELESDPESALLGHYYAVSGEASPTQLFEQLSLPRDSTMLDAFPVPAEFPKFMTREYFDYAVAQYKTSGFRGNLNYYRNSPNIISDTADVQNQKIRQPAAFFYGSGDPTMLFPSVLFGAGDWRPEFESSFDDLRFVEAVEDCGHWLQMEQPQRSAELIIRFLLEVQKTT